MRPLHREDGNDDVEPVQGASYAVPIHLLVPQEHIGERIDRRPNSGQRLCRDLIELLDFAPDLFVDPDLPS